MVDFLPFIFLSLPAGVWVDRLPRRPILIIGDVGRAVVDGDDPGLLRPRDADDLAALRRRVRQRLPHGVLRRRLPELPAVARRARAARRGQRQARDDPVRGRRRRAGRRRDADRPHRRAGRDRHRRAELRGLGRVPAGHPAARADARTRRDRRRLAHLRADRGRRGSPLRARHPLPAGDRRLLRAVEPVHQHRPVHLHPVPRPRARVHAGHARPRVLDRLGRLPRRRPGRAPRSATGSASARRSSAPPPCSARRSWSCPSSAVRWPCRSRRRPASSPSGPAPSGTSTRSRCARRSRRPGCRAG